MKKSGKIIVAVGVIIAVIGVAVMLTTMQGVALVRNGDYVRYDVSVDSIDGYFEGYMNITFSNVTRNSCDVRTEINVPNWYDANRTSHLDQLTALTTKDEIGELNESHIQLDTVFGAKDVDSYTYVLDEQYWYSLCGANPLVQYKITLVQVGVEWTFVISSTNVESVISGNAWTG